MYDRHVANHIANLRHKDPNIRRHAANALGEIGDPSTVPALIGAFNDRTDFVRRKATISLKKIGASAVPALARALKSREEYELLETDHDYWPSRPRGDYFFIWGVAFQPAYAPSVRAIMAELLEASPVGEILFTSDYKFGPNARRYKRPLTLERF